jgi:Xaa-Pro aminopeptidase
MTLNLSKIRTELRKAKLDFWLVTTEEGFDVNSEFLTGKKILGRHAVIVPAVGKTVVLVGRMEESSVPSGFRKTVFSNYSEFRKSLAREIPRSSKVAVNYVRRAFRHGSSGSDFLTHSEFLALKAALPSARFFPAGKLQLLRALRSKDDLKNHRRAISITAEALETVRAEGFSGISELEIAARISSVFSEHGATEAFKTIVSSGPGTSEPHHEPGKRIVRKNEPLMIDLGARWKLCCADVTRTYWIGRSPTEFFKKVYSTVLAAQAFSIRKISPGIRGMDVNSIAEKVLTEKFEKKNILHGLGHSLGYLVHDVGPALSRRENRKLAEGTIVTVEPGLYFPGKLGVRIEDDVLVGKKPENLTKGVPKQAI